VVLVEFNRATLILRLLDASLFLSTNSGVLGGTIISDSIVRQSSKNKYSINSRSDLAYTVRMDLCSMEHYRGFGDLMRLKDISARIPSGKIAAGQSFF
jgi:hypothetical protein